jgi:hypothetical protein
MRCLCELGRSSQQAEGSSTQSSIYPPGPWPFRHRPIYSTVIPETIKRSDRLWLQPPTGLGLLCPIPWVRHRRAGLIDHPKWRAHQPISCMKTGPHIAVTSSAAACSPERILSHLSSKLVVGDTPLLDGLRMTSHAAG